MLRARIFFLRDDGDDAGLPFTTGQPDLVLLLGWTTDDRDLTSPPCVEELREHDMRAGWWKEVLAGVDGGRWMNNNAR